MSLYHYCLLLDRLRPLHERQSRPRHHHRPRAQREVETVAVRQDPQDRVKILLLSSLRSLVDLQDQDMLRRMLTGQCSLSK